MPALMIKFGCNAWRAAYVTRADDIMPTLSIPWRCVVGASYYSYGSKHSNYCPYNTIRKQSPGLTKILFLCLFLNVWIVIASRQHSLFSSLPNNQYIKNLIKKWNIRTKLKGQTCLRKVGSFPGQIKLILRSFVCPLVTNPRNPLWKPVPLCINTLIKVNTWKVKVQFNFNFNLNPPPKKF